MPKIITPKNREHWLQLKTEDISSTESSALFGISPYSTEFELWHQKKSGEIHELEDNERMYCGRMMEDTIAKMVSEQLEIKVRRLKTYIRHDACKGMGSSFDYEIVNHPNGPGLLEIKNVDSLIYRNEWDECEAPPHIESQLQHQLEITDRSWGLIVALVGGNQLRIIERKRNKKVGKAICRRIKQFWGDIKKDNEPEPNFDLDCDFIISMYRTDDGEPLDISNDEELTALVIAHKELKDRANGFEKACKAMKAEVFYRVGNAPKLITNVGLNVAMTNTKDTAPTLVTKEMVGELIGGREGYRQFKITKRKKK